MEYSLTAISWRTLGILRPKLGGGEYRAGKLVGITQAEGGAGSCGCSACMCCHDGSQCRPKFHD